MELNNFVAFEYREPAQLRVPFLFNSPHSGRVYPQSFLQESSLDPFTIRMSEDRYVDLIFENVVRLGAAFMAANFPRSFLDVNREIYELDSEMFDMPLPDYAHNQTVRVKAGLGTIPKIVAANVNIYNKKISLIEALQRIEKLYLPYHKQISQTLDRVRQKFGFAVLIDCHSMPGKLKYFGNVTQPDFILGDDHGRSCVSSFSQFAADILRKKGYTVSLNQPYSGGYITTHYGKPYENVHTLQIEINRNLYLNEVTMRLNDGFSTLKNNMQEFAADLMSFPESALQIYRTAAE